MKRTKFEEPKGLGVMVRTRTAPPASIVTSEGSIEDILFPMLEEVEYGARWISRDEVNKKQRCKEFETYSKINPRLLLKGSGLLIEIYPFDAPKYGIVVQPFVRNTVSATEIRNLPRYNYPSELTDELEKIPEAIRVRIVHNLLYCLDIHFLIVTKTGQFWMEKFASIPHEQYQLAWRKDPNRPDRIQVKADASVGQFHSVKAELKNQLQTLMYYFNKNNNYDRQQEELTKRPRNR